MKTILIKQLSSREQAIFFICVILALVYISLNMVIKPLKAKAGMLDIKIEAAHGKINRSKKIIERGQGINTRYENMLGQFKQNMSNEEMMSSLLTEIEREAGKLNLTISDLKPNTVKSDNGINEYSVSLNIDSPFIDIVRFLHILQSEPHLFKLEQVQFLKTTYDQTELIKTSLVLGKVYIQKEAHNK